MAKKVDNRNLVVVDTFDEFANKVDKLDFEVEDIVALVTSLANTFYWLNVESVWGSIGFTWSKVDDYGVFNKTTIPFTIIPRLPDGHRIKQFINTFDNISSDYIEVKKSDWSNLTTLTKVAKNNKTIKLDVTGANLTYISNLVNGTHASLYLIADCANISQNNNNIFGDYYYGTLIMDDNNKYLNFPVVDDESGITKNQYRATIYWKGTDAFKLEYLFDHVPTTFYHRGHISLKGDNNKYIIKNYKHLISSDIDYTFVVNIADQNNAHVGGDSPIDITIDTTNTDGIIDIIRFFTGRERSKCYDNNNNVMLPIKYIGDVVSIDSYNPCISVENDKWPEYNQELVNKINDPIYHNNLFWGAHLINITKKCPYIIDASNLKELSLFVNMSGNVRDITANEYGAIDWYPEIINSDSLEYLYIDCNATTVFPLLHCDIERIILTINYYRGAFFFKRGTTIRTSIIKTLNNDSIKIVIEDGSIPIITLHPNKDGKISYVEDQYKTQHNSSTEYLDYIRYEINNEDDFKNSTIFTKSDLPKRIKAIHYPYVITNMGTNRIDINIQILNPLYIYRSSIYLKYEYSTELLTKFVNAIKPKGDTDVIYDIAFSNVNYNKLSEEQKNYIVNICNYNLVNVI